MEALAKEVQGGEYFFFLLWGEEKTTAHKAANYMGQQQKKRRQSAFWRIDASKEGVQKRWRATFVVCDDGYRVPCVEWWATREKK